MFNKIKDFCKNHKQEIIIGTTVAAALTITIIGAVRYKQSYNKLIEMNKLANSAEGLLGSYEDGTRYGCISFTEKSLEEANKIVTEWCQKNNFDYVYRLTLGAEGGRK